MENWLELVAPGGVAVASFVGGLISRNFLTSYAEEKGKNLATKEDIAQITHQEEAARAVYNEKLERLRSDIARDAVEHQLRLNSSYDEKLERFRSDIARDAHEHQVQFSRLHERRAEVIAEIYKRLVEVTWEAESMVSFHRDQEHQKEQHLNTLNAITDAFRYLDQHRIFLPELLCDALAGFLQQLKTPAVKVWSFNRIPDPIEKTVQQIHDAEGLMWDTVKEKAPPLRSAIEAEMRRLLGDTSLSSPPRSNDVS